MNRSLTLALLLAPAVAFAQPSIREIDGAPFASTMLAAPAANAVAFVLDARGVRNIWVTDSTQAAARQVTAFTEDDGQELTSLAFSADGRTLYFVRGAAPNRAGENPNPTSDPSGAEQAIWRVRLDGSSATRVTLGASPLPTPSGSDFVFLRRGAVWMATVSGDSTATASLFTMRGSASNVRWSPDGSQLAFVSNRVTYSYVGVYALASKVAALDVAEYRW